MRGLTERGKSCQVCPPARGLHEHRFLDSSGHIKEGIGAASEIEGTLEALSLKKRGP